MTVHQAVFPWLSLALVVLPQGLCFVNAPSLLASNQLTPRGDAWSGLRSLRAASSPVPEPHRRAVLAGLFGTLSLPLTAGAEVIGPPPSAVSSVQSDLQALVSPGHWIGQVIGVNSHTETWKLSASPEESSKALKEVLQNITPQERKKLLFEHIDIKEVSAQRVKVLTWTKSEWLDVLNVSFKALPDGSGTEAVVSLYATGFLPTSIPGAPFINTALFFFPFVSPNPVAGGLLQVTRSQDLYKLVTSRLRK